MIKTLLCSASKAPDVLFYYHPQTLSPGRHWSDQRKRLIEGMDMQVHTVYCSLPVCDTKLKEMRAETDSQLTMPSRTIREGWSKERTMGPQSKAEYQIHWDELSKMNTIIFKGGEILIPTSLCEQNLPWIHAGHMGIEKWKQIDHEILFWPGITDRLRK